MTIWSDYQPAPGDNNSPPPVGAPEGMPPSSVNDCMREMMSVIRQLGDQVSGTFAGLGNMANQNANAVNITGGNVTANLAGNGAGVTNLNAGNLVGVVPPANLAGSYPIAVSWASQANALAWSTSGASVDILVPIGAIIMYYGDLSNVNSTMWAVCDGTRGTPNLVGRFPMGAGSQSDITYSGSSSGTTDAVGAHSHTGATAGYALTIADMPYHDHGIGNVQVVVNTSGGGGIATGGYPVNEFSFVGQGGGQAHAHGIQADGGHAHTFTFHPPAVGLWFLMRVA